MTTCTFFGHKDCPHNIEPLLKEKIIDLINQGVTHFLVGNEGSFDLIVQKVLEEIINTYKIHYDVVLAYLKGENINHQIMFDGFETIHPKFAIEKRNDFMLKKADVIVCYINYSFGGAYKFVKKAVNKKIPVINLGALDLYK